MDEDAAHSEVHSSSLSSSSNKQLHAPAKRDDRDSGYRRNRDHVIHRDHQRERRNEWDHRNIQHNDHRGHRTRQESGSLKQEMTKERMMITVSRDPEPHSDVRNKEEVKMELLSAGSCSKAKCSKGSKKDDKVINKKSDSNNDNKEKTPKRKSPKKKKKKEKKKKKKS